MTWTKLDDNYPLHSKTARAGLEGQALFIGGLCYANRLLTDGIVLGSAVPKLTILLSDRKARRAARSLLDVGQWHDAASAQDCPSEDCRELPRPGDGEYLIHEFHPYQEKAEDVLHRRALNRQRVERHRAKASGNSAGNALPLDPVTHPPTRPDPSRVDPRSEPVTVGSTFSGLLSREEPPSEHESSVDLTALEGVCTPTEAHLLRSICRVNAQFAELKPGQIMRLRREPNGGKVLLEALVQLASTDAHDLAAVERPGAILDLRVSEIRTEMEARTSPETAPNSEQKGA